MKSMTWHLVKKDFRRHWVVLLLWFVTLAAQTIFTAILSVCRADSAWWYIGSVVMRMGPMLQMMFMALIVPLAIQQDPLVDPRAFWLTRPISRRALLAGKAMFLILALILPVLAGELIGLGCHGVGARYLLLATPEILIENGSLVCLISVLAVLTRSFGQYAITLVAFVLSYGVLSAIINAVVLPLVFRKGAIEDILSTGVLQSQAMVGWIATIVIGGMLLAWQFLTRRTRATIFMGVLGLLCILTVKDSMRNVLSMRDNDHSSAIARTNSPRTANLSVTLESIRREDNGQVSRFLPNTLDLALHVNGVSEAQSATISSGSVIFRYDDGCASTGRISISGTKWMVSDERPADGFVSGALKERYGVLRLLNPGTNTPDSRIILHASASIADKSGTFNREQGKAASVTGEVKLAVSEWRLDASVPLRKGSRLTFGTDRDTVVAVAADGLHDTFSAILMHDTVGKSAGSCVTIRKSIVNLALVSGKQHQNITERSTPWSDANYALVNRKHGGEVALGEESGAVDIFYMMTMGLRIGRPARLELVNVNLVFPILTAQWLKDAELVCLKKYPAGTFGTVFEATNVIVQVAEDKESGK